MQPINFQSLARLIIKQYPGTPQIPEAQHHPVYLMTFGADICIHLIGSQPGYLNLVATFPAPECWQTPEGLRALLADNIFSLQHPMLTLGFEAASGKMVLSLRQSLVELSEESVLSLFDDLVQRAIGFCCGKILPPARMRGKADGVESNRTRLAAMNNLSLST